MLTEHSTNIKNNLKNVFSSRTWGSRLIVQLVEYLPNMYYLCKMLPVDTYLNLPNTNRGHRLFVEPKNALYKGLFS